MLFGEGSFPPCLAPLVAALPGLLERGGVPLAVRAAFLEDEGPMQAILNLYPPGAGITPHVDLPHRYGPVIAGVSLLAPVAFEFRPPPASPVRTNDTAFEAYKEGEQATVPAEPRSLWLRPGDVYVLSGAAREQWEHGIAARASDWVEEADGEGTREVWRRLRMSVTLRRVREGGLVVGE